MSPQPIDVTVITSNDCHRCHLVKRKFTKDGIVFTAINAQEDMTIYSRLNGKNAMDFALEDLGIREMPIVIVDDNGEREVWSNYHPAKMATLEQRIASRGELVKTVTAEASAPEVTEELVQELLSDTFGSLHIDPKLFTTDDAREVTTTKNTATIPLIRYTLDGQIGARFTAQLVLTLEGSTNAN